jgi:hypothetical protein
VSHPERSESASGVEGPRAVLRATVATFVTKRVQEPASSFVSFKDCEEIGFFCHPERSRGIYAERFSLTLPRFSRQIAPPFGYAQDKLRFPASAQRVLRLRLWMPTAGTFARNDKKFTASQDDAKETLARMPRVVWIQKIQTTLSGITPWAGRARARQLCCAGFRWYRQRS